MTQPVLGIDVSKLKFNACLIHLSGKLRHTVFSNTSTGFGHLSDWLSKQGVESAHACLEATGTYSEALALFLHTAGHTVSLVNPAAVKAFAQSRLSRTKTDRVDAELIARFCQAQAPPACVPPAAEENRLSAGVTVEVVRRSLEEHLSYLNEQIKHPEELIRRHINHHPTLKQQSELLDSIPGIGEATAAVLLSESTAIKQYRRARQGAAYAGLVPRERQSGSSGRGRARLAKIGNARLRKALYFPAVTALRCSSFFQAWAAGLRQRGKCKMTVSCAVMRKLLHLAYGVLKTGQPFDPMWVKST